VALSPDGCWAATGAWKGTAVKVWDTGRGTLAKEWPAVNATVGFSPDGVWFVTCHGDAYRFFHVGSWQAGLVIPHGSATAANPFAFRPDSQVMAIVKAVRHQSVIQLIDPATGRDIASLQAPEVLGITSIRFSPNGNQLAVATVSHRIQVWDLDRVRNQLATLGLDDGFPSGPTSPTTTAGVKTVTSVRFIGADPIWIDRQRAEREARSVP
jgi:WD40 repeat protein